MSKSRTARGLILVAAAGALLSLSALAAGSVDAARGTAAGGGKPPSSSASLSIYQNGLPVSSVAAGSAIEVRGSGLGANKALYFGWEAQFGMTPVTTDGSGNFTLWTAAPSDPGTYSAIALRQVRKGWEIAASTPLDVR